MASVVERGRHWFGQIKSHFWQDSKNTASARGAPPHDRVNLFELYIYLPFRSVFSITVDRQVVLVVPSAFGEERHGEPLCSKRLPGNSGRIRSKLRDHPSLSFCVSPIGPEDKGSNPLILIPQRNIIHLSLHGVCVRERFVCAWRGLYAERLHYCFAADSTRTSVLARRRPLSAVHARVFYYRALVDACIRINFDFVLYGCLQQQPVLVSEVSICPCLQNRFAAKPRVLTACEGDDSSSACCLPHARSAC